MIKHSPRSWRFTRTSRGILQIRDHHDKCVAMFDWHKDRTADARLIASAPDLLEALQTIMAEVAGCERDAKWETARAAIAKATGESK